MGKWIVGTIAVLAVAGVVWYYLGGDNGRR